nr:hypothetical protein [Tanacetum cinerariifolium]
LLPPRKRIRGAVTASNYDDSTEESYEAYTKPDIDYHIWADIDVDIMAAEPATTGEMLELRLVLGVMERTRPSLRIEVPLRLELIRFQILRVLRESRGHRMLDASKQRVGMLDRIGVLERDNIRLRGMLCVERERVYSLQRQRT